MSLPRRTPGDRAIESSLLAAFVVHALALVTMALLLLPAMPGPGRHTPELRFAYIHAHPFLWHFGWLPWHVSALSDVLLSAALLRGRWIPRRASMPTFILTIVAFTIEQFYETVWDVFAPGFPHAASFLLKYSNYAAFEHHVSLPVTALAAALYALMAIGWSWSLSFTPSWNRLLTLASCIVWPVLLFASLTPLLPSFLRAPNLVVNLANQIGFALMMLWFALALEAVLRRTRVDESVGRMQPWRANRRGLIGRVQEELSNSRFAQYCAEFLPKPVLSSHIHDVVYVNYLVEARHMAALLPEGLELQTLGPSSDLTLFSILSYRHGRFGPRVLGGGASCRGFPSPVQSNWRLYVRHTVTGEPGIFFVSTTFSKLFPAILARILSRGVPMHVPAKSRVEATYGNSAPDTASVQVEVLPGIGSAPDLQASLHSTASPPILPQGDWSACFASYDELLRYSVPQGRALSVQSWDKRVTAQEIDLPAPPSICIPLEGSTHSAYSKALCGDLQSVCFLLPEVQFTMTGERVLQPGRTFSEKVLPEKLWPA